MYINSSCYRYITGTLKRITINEVRAMEKSQYPHHSNIEKKKDTECSKRHLHVESTGILQLKKVL